MWVVPPISSIFLFFGFVWLVLSSENLESRTTPSVRHGLLYTFILCIYRSHYIFLSPNCILTHDHPPRIHYTNLRRDLYTLTLSPDFLLFHDRDVCHFFSVYIHFTWDLILGFHFLYNLTNSLLQNPFQVLCSESILDRPYRLGIDFLSLSKTRWEKLLLYYPFYSDSLFSHSSYFLWVFNTVHFLFSSLSYN